MKFNGMKICKVCGDTARIVNYGALSCQSCKTFFRRNGFHPEIIRPCEYFGQCDVNVLTRRVCSACRLSKCFSIGMSSERIRKEDNHVKRSSRSSKSKRKYTSKPNKLILRIQLPTLDLLENDRSLLTNSEWTLFSNVIHAYDAFSLTPTLDSILKNLSTSSSSDVVYFNNHNVLEVADRVYASMRSFVSSTPDFQVLSINEQQSLFERNLLAISSVSSNVFFRHTNFLDNSICSSSFIQFYGYETVKQIKYFIKQLDLDSTLLKLMLLIIAFSSNCMIVNVHKNLRNDCLIFGTYRLYGSQNVYVELLWKYMLYRYGYQETVIRFSNIVTSILCKLKQIANTYMNNVVLHDYVDELAVKTRKSLIISQNEPNLLWGKTFTYN